MRLAGIGMGLGAVALLGCERSAPFTPDVATEINPEFCWENPFPEGRMTGGGVVRVLADNGDLVRVTHGFTLHCDVTLSNNLEVNWSGNQWHLEKESLSEVSCVDDPAVTPDPPPAPFDTFGAMAWGRFNGVPGYAIHFILQDAGEPSGGGDKAAMVITDPGGAVVLNVPWGEIVGGNLQAHYDQPHGSNVNK